jgi:hypothetical protein
VIVLFAAMATFLAAQATEPPEVRQLVSFRFLPGKTAEAVELFRERALPLYRANEPMLRFRAFREGESPEPLDLLWVSSFRGMAGMDASNRALSEEAKRRGTTVSEIYGSILSLAAAHRDEFVEIDPALSWGDLDEAKLFVFVRMRAAAGRSGDLERMLRETAAWEKQRGLLTGAEGGRLLISAGFDFLRVLGISDLGDWHDYARDLRSQPFTRALEECTAESRQAIVAPVAELSVR